MESPRSFLYRIRWGSVIALVLLVLAFYVLYTSAPSGYNVSGGVGIFAEVDPAVASPGQTINIKVELKNMYSDKGMTVVLRGKTYNDMIFFDETFAQTYSSKQITIGPQEIRRINILLRTKSDIYIGKYTIDLEASEANKPQGIAKQRVSVDIDTETP